MTVNAPGSDTGLVSGFVAEGSQVLQFFDSPEAKKRFLACLRTALGVASVYHHPYLALGAAGLSLLSPPIAKQICTGVDGGLTGLWNNMPIIARVSSAALGVGMMSLGLHSMPVNVLSGLFASKVGSELAVTNYYGRTS